jgi:nicotinamidase-related amidase
VLLVDHQTGLISLVQDFSPNEFKNNVLALGDIAKFFKLPTILTTSFDAGPNGPIVPELREQFPDAPFIPVLARSTPGTTKISSRRSRPPAASN